MKERSKLSIIHSTGLAVLLSAGACATDTVDAGVAGAGKADSAGSQSAPVLTCEDAQSADDPRSHWQIWLTAKNGAFVVERVASVYDPYEDDFSVEKTVLGTYDSCVASAVDATFVTCRNPGASFFYSSQIDKTVIPLGGSELVTTSKLQLTYQETGPGDRESVDFRPGECWASTADRIGGSESDPPPDTCPDLGAVNDLVDALNASAPPDRTYSTDFDWVPMYDGRAWPGHITGMRCRGIDLPSPINGAELDPQLVDVDVAAGMLQAWASSAGIDATAAIEALTCHGADLGFRFCDMSFEPDPWSGIDWDFFVAEDQSIGVFRDSRWYE